jgi:hypothetical protein
MLILLVDPQTLCCFSLAKTSPATELPTDSHALLHLADPLTPKRITFCQGHHAGNQGTVLGLLTALERNPFSLALNTCRLLGVKKVPCSDNRNSRQRGSNKVFFLEGVLPTGPLPNFLSSQQAVQPLSQKAVDAIQRVTGSISQTRQWPPKVELRGAVKFRKLTVWR